MKKYARIENNIIQEIIIIDQDINELYHPLVVEQFQEFNEDAEVGYSLVEGVWTAPKVLTEEEIKQLEEQLNKV